ncbi:putative Ubiquitin carboxyl-terminal hydrolase 4 [Paratrimastix pyriformis]|uniref:ubiquitinyl hydrolase 1 n=1 Tax=Paratrimastix pyriformis TaxID=342808 RepID=A0ABQ8UNC9_9EUKA|nr:putative Ubiquitin carboxyl-terminal hydrolase 4 [Paratrimastix pyriformis]
MEPNQANSEPSVEVPQPAEQKDILSPLLKHEMTVGDTYFLVPAQWWRKFKQYIFADDLQPGESSADPGAIDCSDLIDSTTGKVRLSLMEEMDFVFVHEAVWEKIFRWYQGGPPIARKAIADGSRCIVEVMPYTVKVSKTTTTGLPDPASTKVITVSRNSTAQQLLELVATTYSLSQDKIRLWDYYSPATATRLTDLSRTIQEIPITDGQNVLAEVQLDDGAWPKSQARTGGLAFEGAAGRSTQAAATASGTELGFFLPFPLAALDSLCLRSVSWFRLHLALPSFAFPSARPRLWCAAGKSTGTNSTHISSTTTGTSYTYPSSSYKSSYWNRDEDDSYSSYYRSTSRALERGLVGFHNLGNTCFMNSALQCLSHCVPLTNFFLADHYLADINTKNPLGLQGRMANAWAELVKSVWSGESSTFAPRTLKAIISQFAHQFSGYQQQDAQEFLGYLLDALHEDLNRVTVKPITENHEADGRPDLVVAHEAWETYLLRNRSVIIDLFHMQVKSAVDCPECGRQSVTFDPMAFLSVPLPVERDRKFACFLIRRGSSAVPIKFALKVPKMGTMAAARRQLAQLSGIPLEQLILCECWTGKIYDKIADSSAVADQRETVLYGYEVAGPCTCKPKKTSYDTGYYSRPREEASPPSGENDLMHMFTAHRKDETVTYSSYSTYSYVQKKNFGVPLVISFAAKQTTCRQVHQQVWDSIRRMITPEAWTAWYRKEGLLEVPVEVPTKLPYELQVVQDSYYSTSGLSRAATAKYVPITDESAACLMAYEGLVLVWAHPEVYSEDAANDLVENESCAILRRVAGEETQRRVQLTECLDLFTSREQLNEENAWYCSRCKKHQQAFKKFDIWRLPEILVIHLKRFSHSRGFRSDKVDTLVDFPLTMDLSAYERTPRKPPRPSTTASQFRSNHSGGLGGGHYTAYCKNPITRKWYHFNDSSVSEVHESHVVSSSAYMMVFRRRSPRADETVIPYPPPVGAATPLTDLRASTAATAAGVSSPPGGDDTAASLMEREDPANTPPATATDPGRAPMEQEAQSNDDANHLPPGGGCC